jgi:hypothetical protein
VEHKLKIISFDDVQAKCEGCSWTYVGTGERSLAEIKTLYSLQTEHRKNKGSQDNGY